MRLRRVLNNGEMRTESWLPILLLSLVILAPSPGWAAGQGWANQSQVELGSSVCGVVAQATSITASPPHPNPLPHKELRPCSSLNSSRDHATLGGGEGTVGLHRFCTPGQGWGTVPEDRDPRICRADSPCPRSADDERFQVPKTDDPQELRQFITELLKHRAVSRDEDQARRKAVSEAAERLMALTEDDKGEDYFFAVQQQILSQTGRFNQAVFDRALAYLREKNRIDAMDLSLAQRIAMSAPTELQKELTARVIAVLSVIDDRFSDQAVRQAITMMEGTIRFADLVGKPLRLGGTTIEGQDFALEELRGQVVLVDFWATWCTPCLAEHPQLLAMHRRYAEEGFEIVAVSLDRDRDALENYLEDRELPWINLHDAEGDSEAVTYYGIRSIPTMILLDRQGRVLSTNARGAELERLLAEQFPDESP